MRVEVPSEDNIAVSEGDGGSVVNKGDQIVLLREPNVSELSELFEKFEKKLKRCMKSLLCQNYKSVSDKYGQLCGTRKHNARNDDDIYGTLVTSWKLGKYLSLLKIDSVTKEMTRMAILPSDHEKRAEVLRRGGCIGQLESLPQERKAELVENLIENCEIDDYFSFHKGSRAGIEELRAEVGCVKASSIAEFLDRIAASFSKLAFETVADTNSAGRNVSYAATWFTLFLASQGIWLLPMRLFPRVRLLVPRRLLPLVMWLSTPDYVEDIIDSVFRVSSVTKQALYIVPAFVVSATSSDMWSTRRFCSHPLELLKDWAASRETYYARTVSVNRLYSTLGDVFGIDLASRTEIANFDGGYRNSAEGGSFRWCSDPTPRNTAWVAKLIGREVHTIPQFVKVWATALEEVLPLLDSRYPKPMVALLNCWLAYLLTTDETGAPRTFREIDPEKHGKPFVDFISKAKANYKSPQAYKTVSALKKAWMIVARRENFHLHLPNPFEFPVEGTRTYTPDPSGRESMDADVWAFLVKLNYQDDYGFARKFGKYWKELKNIKTGLYERVFWGMEARVLDVILSNGFRLIDARWLDSGECDDEVLNIHTLEYVKNRRKTRIKGRRQGFLQRLWLDKPEPRFVLAGWRIQDKSNKPKLVPYVEERLARMMVDVARMQTTYNRLEKQVPFVDRVNRHKDQNLALFPSGAPLFRQTGKMRHYAVSTYTSNLYWAQFLKYAQPLLDDWLGRHYPLFDGKYPRFSIHDLRVTNVTIMLERGEPLEVVQAWIGHESKWMTAHYAANKHAMVHNARRRLVEERDERLKLTDRELVQDVIESEFRPENVKDYVGIEVAGHMMAEGHFSGLAGFGHGLCPGGVCAKGGPIVSGKPTSVWRMGACARCRFRVTGPRFLEGVRRHANSLLYEIFDSQRRERMMNEELEQREQAEGPLPRERSAIRIEHAKRDELMKDAIAEIATHRGLEVLYNQMATMKMSDADRTLVPTSRDFNIEETTFSLVTAHEYQLLHDIVGAQVLPSSVLEVPSLIGARYRELSRALMRATGVDDFLENLKPNSEHDVMYSFGEAIVTKCDRNNIQSIIDGTLDETSFANLAGSLQQLRMRLPELKHG